MNKKLKDYYDGIQPDKNLKNRVQRETQRAIAENAKPAPIKPRAWKPGVIAGALCACLLVFAVVGSAITVKMPGYNDKLVTFSSKTETTEYVKGQLKNKNKRGVFGNFLWGCSSKNHGGDAEQPENEENFNSSTNVQVEGVDEADIVKHDGRTIYSIPKNSYDSNNTLYVTDTQTQTYRTVKLSFAASEMYLSNGILTVLGQAGGDPWASNGNSVVVEVFNAETLVSVRQMRIGESGMEYVTSRKVNDMLYVIARQNVYNEETYPKVQESAGTAMKDVDVEKVYAVPTQTYNVQYTYLSAINVATDAEPDTQVFIGNTNEIYLSGNSLYTASSGYNATYNLFRGVNTHGEAATVVNRYTLEDGKVNFAETGTVEGFILNQFAMDEYDGAFRIAASLTGGGASVYVLNKETMQVTGSATGLGQANRERVYAVRFMGDFGYVVTARQTDPLYAVDLRDKTNPKVTDAFKTPDIGRYLHPYDENTLIGFGGIDGTRGIKVTLFDVSDKTDLKPIAENEDLGQNCQSEITYNHKALLYLKQDGYALFGFPVSGYSNYSGRKEQGAALFVTDGKTLRLLPRVALPQELTGSGNRAVVVNGKLYLVTDFGVAQYALNLADGMDGVTVEETTGTVLFDGSGGFWD